MATFLSRVLDKVSGKCRYRNGNRYSDLEAQDCSTVTYDGIYVNTENGLDISSGKFKAPVTGTYAIHFNAVNIDESSSGSHYLLLQNVSKYNYYAVRACSEVNKVINIQSSNIHKIVTYSKLGTQIIFK